MLKDIASFLRSTLMDVFKFFRSPRTNLKYAYGMPIYRNALYLVTNSVTTALLGAVFWILAARLYSPEDVGLGSALISAGTLISFIGTLGLGMGIIRFLSSSANKTQLLNSCFTIAFLASTVIAIVFLGGLSLWSPKLMFVCQNPFFFTTFVVFVALMTWGGILNSTFIGLRRANFTLAKGLITNLSKLLFVLVLASILKVFGIFASWGLAVTVGLAISLLFFLPTVLPHYRPVPCFQKQLNKEMIRFTFVNYIGETLRVMPNQILPLMVLHIIGSEANAYFYITWSMAGLLIAISGMTSFSLFAEGSHDEERLGVELRRSLKLVVLLLIPAIIAVFLLGDKILLLFGREYSTEGTQLLWLLAVAALPASINLLYLGKIRVERKLKEILFLTGGIALGTLVISYLLLPRIGILGGGVGWLASQTTVAFLLLPRLRKGTK